jgi:hypothetical protein
MRVKQAQSVVEYVILAAVVIVVVVLGSGKFFSHMIGNNGAFGKHFDNMRQRMGVQPVP